MPARAYFFAALTFALGLCIGLFVHFSGYDRVISSLHTQNSILKEIIREQKAELNEINAILREPAESP
jgi:hypothetical protein